MARKKILCADNSAWKKAIDAFGQAEKPIIKVEGCKTDSAKPEKVKKPYQRKRLTFRERTALWQEALNKSGKLPPKPEVIPTDWWSLPIPDYDKPTIIPVRITDNEVRLHVPDTAKTVSREQQEITDKWLPEAMLEVKLYNLMMVAEKFPTL